jgi:SAM-dependent methyltransferase
VEFSAEASAMPASRPNPLRRAAKKFRARFKDVRKRWKYLKDRELRATNRALVRQGAPDGMPLPPPFLVYKVSSKFDLRRHLESGPQSIDLIEQAIAPSGLALQQFRSILDWGCGCGRVVRHLAKRFEALGTQVRGCDYNPQLIRWCQRSLPCAEFKVCGLAPPLPYPDASFDFVYAISVLTHIPTELQLPWMRELRRVLRPGGHALLVVGDGILDDAPEDAPDAVASAASPLGLEPVARASQARPVHDARVRAVFGDRPRREHLLLLRKK